MVWFLLTTLIIARVSTLLLRALAVKRSEVGPVVISNIFLVVGGIALPIYGLFVGVDLKGVIHLLPYLLVSVPAFVIGVALIFKSLEYLDASFHTIVNQLAHLVATIALAYFLLGETLYGLQWLGAAAIVAGLVVNRISNWDNSKLVHGFIYAVLGAVLTGVGVVISKVMIDVAGLGAFLIVGSLSVSVAAIIFHLAWQKWHKLPLIPSRHHLHGALIACGSVSGALESVIYFAVLVVLDNIAYLTAVSGFALVLVVVLEVFLLREFTSLANKIVGLGLAVLGLFLLA